MVCSIRFIVCIFVHDLLNYPLCVYTCVRACMDVLLRTCVFILQVLVNDFILHSFWSVTIYTARTCTHKVYTFNYVTGTEFASIPMVICTSVAV